MSDDFRAFIDDVLMDKSAEVSEDGTPLTFEDKYEKFMGDIREHLLNDLGPVRLHELQGEAEQRYSTVMPLGTMRSTTIALIGLGGLGNWISKVLVSMGCKNLHVFDMDTVGPENIGPQAHKIVDLGLPKTEAVRRECLELRGVELAVHNVKIERLADIHRAVGCRPEVIIGATDSAEFRNAMIADMDPRNADPEIVPDLFVDLRMSLGDWNAFLWTPKIILGHMPSEEYVEQYENYVTQAVFSSEEAVTEPCTARAITYTGANVASYVGALLHWWFSEGKRRCEDGRHWLKYCFYADSRDDTAFNWLYRFSSREFLPQTFTAEQQSKMAVASSARMTELALRGLMYNSWNGSFPNSITENQWESSNRPMVYLDHDGECHLLLRGAHTFNGVPADTNGRAQYNGNECRLTFPYMLDFHLEDGYADFIPNNIVPAAITDPDRLFDRNNVEVMLASTLYNDAGSKALSFPDYPLIHDAPEGSKGWAIKMAMDSIHASMQMCPRSFAERFVDSPKFPGGNEILFNVIWRPDCDDELFLIKLCEPEEYEEDRRVRYSFGAYKFRTNFSGDRIFWREPAIDCMRAITKHFEHANVLATGWTRPGATVLETDFSLVEYGPDGSQHGVSVEHHLPREILDLLYDRITSGRELGQTGNGNHTLVGDTEEDAGERTVRVEYPEEGLVDISGVEDGTVVTVDGIEGSYVKHSSGAVIWLQGGSADITVRVHPEMRVRPLEEEE